MGVGLDSLARSPTWFPGNLVGMSSPLMLRDLLPVPTPTAAMGVKMLQCFPFHRRSKERCKRQCSSETAVAKQEVKPRLSSTTSWGSEGDGVNCINCTQAYFSHKARLSLRHQLDSNINAVDATY
ncbi:hypothetical protein DNTS_013229 [Danionella cerebrum]|uniref:Uncharacterized protein n=1 Tax=Danionella cerebrum TaxID=2873325 RepID=A0A553Q5U7_9TELE|nr:hypothetical protein DNTS_013229 [Danionella translucida]